MSQAGQEPDGTPDAVSDAVSDVEDGLVTLFDAFRRSRARLQRDEGLAHLSLSEFAVLRAVAQVGGQGVGRVAAHADMRQPPASRAIDRLVERGLVTKVQAAGDRRRSTVELTTAGTGVLSHHRRRLSAAARRLLELHPHEELGQLLRALAQALDDATSSYPS
jgi:DNA-binding MarR family transcriptional regulator